MNGSDFRRTASLLLTHLDPMTVRFIMMCSSFWWAGFLIIYPGTFKRHGYEYLRIVGNEYVWAGIFLFHALPVLWRFMEVTKSREIWTKVFHLYGLAVWTYSTAATNVAIGQMSPATGMEWMMIGAGVIVLFKLGNEREVVTL
ncbi:hypothetical protein Lumi_031 [Xylophilus phage Lumi]|nr:hypothetical protein Lumi_031 [Xylophilus phage Lumi]